MGIFVYLILGGLAAFRITEMLVVDDGPYDIFARFRGYVSQVSVPLPEKSKVLTNISSVFQCVHCMGLWVSIPIIVTYYIHNFYTAAFILYFALAGLQSVLARRFGRSG